MTSADPPLVSTPRRVGLGVGLSAGQTVVNAVVLFGLYRFVRGEVGLAAFGVWSLVVSSTLSAGVAEFGMGGAALRFVAHALGRDAPEEASAFAETAVLSSLALLGAAALLLYAPLSFGLAWFLRHDLLPLQHEAQRLLPLALLNLVLNGGTMAALGALDGAQRVHLRALLSIAGSVLLGAFALVFVPRFGLVGFTLAQTMQLLLLGAAGWAMLRHALPGLRGVPLRWSRLRFRTLIGYGTRWQVVALLNLLADPATKTLAKLYGGLGFVGDYEFASKVATQLRSVLATAYLALTPFLTRTFAQAPERLGALYVLGVRTMGAVVLLVLPAVVALSPLAGLFWSGSLASDAGGLLALLFFGWCLNLLSAPAYIDFTSRAMLGPIIVSHAVYAGANVALGFMLGQLLGGLGVGVATMLAYSLASLTTVLLYWHRVQRHQTASGLGTWGWRYDAGIAVAALMGSGGLAWLVAQPMGRGGLLLSVGAGVAGYGILALVLLWRHPLRRAFAKRLNAEPAA